MQTILKNLNAIALLLEKTTLLVEALAATMNDENNDAETSVKNLLPDELHNPSLNTKPLEKALKVGLMRAEGHHLVWLGSSKVLLVYLLGRVWAGDAPKFDPKLNIYYWKAGKGHFPDAQLCRLFKTSGLRSIRNARITGCLPNGYKTIDGLF